MTNFKGTKGKWKSLSTNEDREWVNIGSYKGVIARSFYGEMEPIVTKEEGEFNAFLISKAPEMLEMLENILEENMTDYGVCLDMKDKIEQLIKEATEL